MALCDYHEDTEAVATCVVCKSSICGKCQEFGADGMCGMCLEMSNARKASNEASRQARVEAAPAAPPKSAAPQKPAAPSKLAAPQKPTTPPRPPAKAPAVGLAKGAAANGAKAPQAGSKPASKGGFCGEHDGQQMTAACTNCRKKVCPYCLDLYDLCVECRNLPHCSRHESMVSAAKCESCNLDYCSVCLDNTAFCDRCRTLGMARVSAARQSHKVPTGKLDPAKGARPGTGNVEPAKGSHEPSDAPVAPGVPGTRKVAITPPKPGQPGFRPPAKSRPLGAKAATKGARAPALLYVVGGLLLLGAAGYILLSDSRPRLSPEEANAAILDEMKLVQTATIAIQEKTGRLPVNADQLLVQLEAQGVDLKKVNPPLKIVINTLGTEPLTVVLKTTPEGYEIHALDFEGRPLAKNGRDVILMPATIKDAPKEAPKVGDGG